MPWISIFCYRVTITIVLAHVESEGRAVCHYEIRKARQSPDEPRQLPHSVTLLVLVYFRSA